jgi:hypothetical protein
MALWTFKCFVSQSGRDLIDEWYSGLPTKAKVKLDSLLEHFRDNPHHKWGANYFKPLTGYDGIFEIRFQILNVLYRPLGYFGPQRGDYTFLIGAWEQGDDWVPEGAPDIAVKRRAIVIANEKRAHECDF